MKRALLSVTDKTGIVELGSKLVSLGYELISTGGTAKVLREANLTVTDVAAVTGFPEMMGGRLKTLHPKVFGGILARRDEKSDLDAMQSMEISMIEVVVVNLYQFNKVAAKKDVTFGELIENIDIGGPSMIRAAAKNFRDVLVVVDPRDYKEVLLALGRENGPSLNIRYQLAKKAIKLTAEYDHAISYTLSKYYPVDGDFFRIPED